MTSIKKARGPQWSFTPAVVIQVMAYKHDPENHRRVHKGKDGCELRGLMGKC